MKFPKYRYDILQRTEEWFKIKELKMSASHATAIANCGKGLDTYIMKMITDRIVGRKELTNKDIDRGIELEPEAISHYIEEIKCEGMTVGVVEYNDYVLVSPDLLVDENGLAEFKARNDSKHLDLLLTEKVDSSSIWQCQMQMFVTQRDWCDYVSYNPNFSRKMFIKRIFKDEEKFKCLTKGFEIGAEKIKSYLKNEVIQNELLQKVKW